MTGLEAAPPGKKHLPARPRHSALGGSVGRGDLRQSTVVSCNDVSLNETGCIHDSHKIITELGHFYHLVTLQSS